MDFKQLESYAAVVRLGSFTRAARQLYLSQPTVSTHIRTLEEELGVPLLNRTTKALEVTPAGQRVYDHVCSLLELRDRMIRECTPDAKTILHLGASTIPAAYILPQVLPEFSARHPNCFFVIHQCDSRAVAAGVAEGRFDLGLAGSPSEAECVLCEPFCQDRMVLIAPVTERYLDLAAQPEIPLEELLRSPIILREQGGQKNADRFLRRLGVPEESLNVCARVNDPEATKNLVAGGLGISIISERAAGNFLRERRLLKFDLPDTERSLYLLHRRDRMNGPKLEELTSFLHRFGASKDFTRPLRDDIISPRR